MTRRDEIEADVAAAVDAYRAARERCGMPPRITLDDAAWRSASRALCPRPATVTSLSEPARPAKRPPSAA